VGKIRLKQIGSLELEKEQKEKAKKRRQIKKAKKIRAPGLKGGERVVAVGPTEEEIEKLEIKKLRKEKPSLPSQPSQPSLPSQSSKPSPIPRSSRYQKAVKLIDKTKAYPVKQAIKLLRQVSLENFKGKAEVHFNLKETGFKAQITLPHPPGKIQCKTEKKFPLIHLIFGKMEAKDDQLAENLQTLINSIGPTKIKKAVIKSTISPRIKIAI